MLYQKHCLSTSFVKWTIDVLRWEALLIVLCHHLCCAGIVDIVMPTVGTAVRQALLILLCQGYSPLLVTVGSGIVDSCYAHSWHYSEAGIVDSCYAKAIHHYWSL